MKIIIGLGNIGAHFDGTRHNIGFHILDVFAKRNTTEWQQKDKFKASIGEATLHGQKVVLVKPDTYYNNSGEAVRAVRDFYKLANSDVLVIHDELDLPFGTLRARIGGTDAGNNGIKSVIAHIGEDFARLRIGVAAGSKAPAAEHIDYVLGQFTVGEHAQLSSITVAAIALIDTFIDDDKKFEHASVRPNLNNEGAV